MSFKMCKPHYNQWEASQLLKVVVNPSLEVLALRYDESIRIFLVQLQTKGNTKLQLRTSQPTLGFCNYVVMLIGSTKEVGVMQTHLLLVATCYVLWGVKKFHQFLHFELQKSSLPIIWCHHF